MLANTRATVTIHWRSPASNDRCISRSSSRAQRDPELRQIIPALIFVLVRTFAGRRRLRGFHIHGLIESV
jgi:hypothetical protein